MTHPAQHRPRRSPTWHRLSALAGAASLVAAAALFLVPSASAATTEPALNDASTPYLQNQGIPICHATNSDTNPYVSESPDFDSIIKKNGHDSHDGPVWEPGLKDKKIKWGDIIPAFYYSKNGVDGYFAGQNWDADGKAIWGANCKPAGTPPPSGAELTLVKTATPSVYSAAGQTITYTFTVINSGNKKVTGLSVVDKWTSSGGTGKISSVDCPDNKLDAGKSMTCTAEYKTTADDVRDGKDLINTAYAKGKAQGTDVESDPDTATVTPTASVRVDKTWIIGGKTYDISHDKLPAGFSATPTVDGVSNPEWGTTYGGFTPGDTVTIGESVSIPSACSSTSAGTGAQAIAVGANVFRVTNTVTCSASVTLAKVWVNPIGGSTDAVDLTIGGAVAGAVVGTSHATGVAGDTPATATASQGSTITLNESFTSGDPASYDTTLQCSVDNGAAISVPVAAHTGSFIVPADALAVDCTFVNTNNASTSTVNLTKSWGATVDAGDTVRLRVRNVTTAAVDTSGTSSAAGTSGTSSVTVFPGDSFELSEDPIGATDLSHYDVIYACAIAGTDFAAEADGTFTVPAGLAAGSTIDCTITNTHKTMLNITKEWLIDGVTYTVPQGAGPALPASYGATLTVDGIDTAWGTAFAVGAALPVLAEKDITTPADCSVSQALPDLSSLTTGVDNTATVVNTVTCTDDDDIPPAGGGGTPPAGGGTPPAPVVEVLPEAEEVVPAPTVEVQGESQEVLAPVPAIEVAGVSREVPAPSANAHTGQGTTPWVYALLATGLVLMLGAAGARRRGQA